MIGGFRDIARSVFLWIVDNPLKASVTFLGLLFALAFFLLFFSPEKKRESSPTVVENIQDPGEVVERDDEYVSPDLPIRERVAAEKYIQKMKKRSAKEKSDEPLHFDGSEEEIAEREAYISSQGALYDLPYRGDTIAAKYKEVLPDSRYLIVVRYTEGKKEAKREWEKYLEKHNDSGDTYFVIYKK